MKSRMFTYFIILVLLNSCVSLPNYVPEYHELGTHPMGSFTRINLNGTNLYFEGELIAINDQYIYFIQEPTKNTIYTIDSVRIEHIYNLDIFFGKNKNYGWAAPFALLFPISQGWFGILTLLPNIIVVLSSVFGSEQAYNFTNIGPHYPYINEYCRFPQGLPEEIDIKEIK